MQKKKKKSPSLNTWPDFNSEKQRKLGKLSKKKNQDGLSQRNLKTFRMLMIPNLSINTQLLNSKETSSAFQIDTNARKETTDHT